jgi:hypothetical protein
MNNLDFFKEYESYKRKTQGVFESLDKKINSGNPELNEALFGLIKGAKEKSIERENELKNYFNKLLNAPQWQNYKIDTGNGEVEIDSATQNQIENAWEVIRAQGLDDSFTGMLKQDGDSIIYQKGKGKPIRDNQQSTDQDPNQDPNPDPNAQPQNTLPTYQITYDKKSGRYLFGSPDRYANSINNALSEIQTYNFEKSPLKVLFEDPLKFGLREITFDFKEGNVASARDGFWIGDFVGRFFDAAFVGNSFRGAFANNNEEWKSNPTAFISGTFKDRSKTGLLGLDDAKQGSENSPFHLIQLPPGYSIEVLTDKQLRHTITCEKRLDNVNSNFVYSVYKGYEIDNSSPESITLPWEAIRENYNSYIVSKKFKNLPDLFSLNSNEKIIELRVVESGTPPVFKFREKFDEKKKYSEDLVNLRGLKQVSANIPAKSLKFNFTNQSELDNFSKIKSYINSNQFENDLKKASVYLDNKLISSQDIKSKFPYLINVFTSDVLSEATVNLANPKKTYGRKAYSAVSGRVKNPITGKNFEEAYEIADYLNQKYKAAIDANGGRKPDAYQKEYKKLYDAVFGAKSSTSSSSDSSNPVEVGGMAKEESIVLRRIENFVKYFVYKIDNGKSTNKIRKYFIDLIKAKITAHKASAQTTATATPKPTPKPTASTTTTPTPTKGVPKKGAIGKLKESVVRNEIRKILNDLL